MSIVSICFGAGDIRIIQLAPDDKNVNQNKDFTRNSNDGFFLAKNKPMRPEPFMKTGDGSVS